MSERTIAPFPAIYRHFDDLGYRVYPAMIWGESIDAVCTIIQKFATEPERKYLFIMVGDCENPPAIELTRNVVLFRTSLSQSRRQSTEYVFPYPFEPLAETDWSICNRTRCPKLAFCGFATQPSIRVKAIAILQQQTEIQCDFILRNAFWGGKPHDPGIMQDFRSNMHGNEFNLCLRGKGNFSIRFYQTLAYGRIPVVVDTDMVWPLAGSIPWDELCVIASSAEALPRAIHDFWMNKDVEIIQQQCRQVYEEYFSFSNIARSLGQELAGDAGEFP